MTAALPTYKDLLWPALLAVRDLGGSASIEEIDAEVHRTQQFSEQQQRLLRGAGPRTEIEYRLAWARSYLKGMGLLTNSSRGIWSLTAEGRRARSDDLETLRRDYDRRRLRDARASQEGLLMDELPLESTSPSGDETTPVTDELLEDALLSAPILDRDWRDELLEILAAMAPDAFERLAGRLLTRAGYEDVQVTGKTGDGGIDGVAVTWEKLSSFRVYFQCKRYSASVGPDAIRDFRGALDGRGERGLLITNSRFTDQARQEAHRAGARHIDLIDGRKLCELLREYELGVTTTIRQVEDQQVDKTFFEDL
ncbi:restriction endonuclease [Nonomuraea typhae]|uniref:Restriction endonuclease n=1 Tax=Nonomuraea typhae TaxID=2603600 RepID=A0ABW7YVG4_9ACTN